MELRCGGQFGRRCCLGLMAIFVGSFFSIYIIISFGGLSTVNISWSAPQCLQPTIGDLREKVALVQSQEADVTSWTPRKVLIITYGRSGSSFVGDVISHSPEVYFVYEPLRKLDLPLGVGHIKRISSQAKDVVIGGLLNCNFTAPLFLNSVDERFLGSYNETQVLAKCLTTWRGKLRRANEQFNSCIRRAQAVCRDHAKVVIKTLRYAITSTRELLTSDPDVAVIYLIRDFRGNVLSRMRVFKAPKANDTESWLERSCSQIRSDLLQFISMFRKFSHRIRFLRYEDLAMKPLEVSKNIYSFLQLPWTPAIEQRVIAQTLSSRAPQSSSGDEGVRNETAHEERVSKGENNATKEGEKMKMNTAQLKFLRALTRGDSYKAALSWRNKISWNLTATIQKTCLDVFSLWGYRPFQSEHDLRSAEVPNREEFELASLLTVGQDINPDLGDV